MDFEKLAKLIDPGIAIDVERADIHNVRATSTPENIDSWRNFTPEKYSSEEELAATINNALRADRIADKEIYAGYR